MAIPQNSTRSGRAQAYFGASVFWLRRLAALGGEEEAVAHWQLKRNGEGRGIIQIVEEKR